MVIVIPLVFKAGDGRRWLGSDPSAHWVEIGGAVNLHHVAAIQLDNGKAQAENVDQRGLRQRLVASDGCEVLCSGIQRINGGLTVHVANLDSDEHLVILQRRHLRSPWFAVVTTAPYQTGADRQQLFLRWC